ncbi:hypothetical protein [Staphylococcus pseudoxylosus]|uniref:hypothetical protein n=1 Tax=Staphylococcus pseudoxylosus TaxID=2282419 RepID=UPI001939CEFF|nr:hypothetical protein [Staphylococcus pseudoxylosus]MBM2659662.1 hypothetical protein [Staphylococcus pseudoxylosus]
MSPEEEMVINRNIMKLQEHLYKALKQRDQYKAERDTLIDDIAVLKANISRLERELEAALNGELSTYDELLKYVMELQSELMEYQKENEELYNIANKEMDIAESENEKYIKLTQHIRLKAENNPGVSRYIDLVNYIDRLERD